MKTPAIQGLDLLLGIASQQPNMIGQNNGATDGSPLFGDLLSLLVASGQPVTPEMPLFGEQSLLTARPGNPSEKQATFANPNVNALLLPETLLFKNQDALQNLFAQIPGSANTDLTKGLAITNLTENGASITLTLTPVADPEKPISLTIAKDTFVDLMQQANGQGDLPNFESSEEPLSSRLETLLTKLNTTDIKISNAAVTSDTKQPQLFPVATPVRAELFPKESVKEPILKVQPTQHQRLLGAVAPLLADLIEPSAISENETPQLNLSLPRVKLPVQPGFVQSIETHLTGKPVTPVEPEQFFTLPEKQTSLTMLNEKSFSTLTSEQSKSSAKLDQFGTILSTTNSNVSQATIDKLPSQPTVRPTLQLPENLAESLKPFGKTVTLRIEPEHLGTATVSLQMSGGALRARVVVESQAAKSMLDGSLGQLVNQLAKSNITVDRVEVLVSNHNLGEHPSQQQQRGNRQQKQNNRNTEIEPFPSIAGVTPSLSGYMPKAASGRLNLVA